MDFTCSFYIPYWLLFRLILKFPCFVFLFFFFLAFMDIDQPCLFCLATEITLSKALESTGYTIRKFAKGEKFRRCRQGRKSVQYELNWSPLFSCLFVCFYSSKNYFRFKSWVESIRSNWVNRLCAFKLISVILWGTYLKTSKTEWGRGEGGGREAYNVKSYINNIYFLNCIQLYKTAYHEAKYKENNLE